MQNHHWIDASAKIGVHAELRLQIEFLAAIEHQFDAMSGPLLDLRSKHHSPPAEAILIAFDRPDP